MYQFLSNKYSLTSLVRDERGKFLARLWESYAPSKVISFPWQFLRRRLPKRVHLAKKGMFIRGDDFGCQRYSDAAESEDYLFVPCGFASKVWLKSSGGLVIECCNREMFLLYRKVVSFLSVTRTQRDFYWFSVQLCGQFKSHFCFYKVLSGLEDVDVIKNISCQWFLEKHSRAPCLFYEMICKSNGLFD